MEVPFDVAWSVGKVEDVRHGDEISAALQENSVASDRPFREGNIPTHAALEFAGTSASFELCDLSS